LLFLAVFAAVEVDDEVFFLWSATLFWLVLAPFQFIPTSKTI
jgi:hypothetical protein